jgi:glycosyltransferase involved in cell wall biosynthesis/tRNA A-37 threonylcarbamoyl transferase component Bud32
VRWLFINPIGKQGWGGMEGWMCRLARELRKLGDECHIVGRTSSPWPHVCAEHHLPFHAIPFGSEFSPRTWVALRRIVGAVRPDAAVIKGFKQARWLRLVSARVATAVKLPGAHELSGDLVARATVRWCVDRILTDCEATRRAFLRHPWLLPGRVVAIPNGVDSGGPWPDLTRQQQARAQLLDASAPHDIVVIASVGRLTAEKRWDDAIEALTRVAARLDFRWIVIGDGPLRAQLQQRVATRGWTDRVRWLGYREDARGLLWGADLLLHTSGCEGLSNVLLEAMAAGLPIVATNAGGTSEAVIHGLTGFVVPVGAVEEIAEALSRLIQQPELRRTFGAAGAANVRARFTLEVMAQQIRRVMEEVVHHRVLRAQPTLALDDGWRGILAPTAEASHITPFLRGDRTGWTLVKKSPRIEVWRRPSSETDLYAKLYRPARTGQRLAAHLRAPRARSNLLTAAKLRLRGADVVPHLAAAWRGSECVLFTGSVPGAVPLDDASWLSTLTPPQRRRLAADLGTWLARLHAAWIVPHDLKTSNLLRTSDDRLWLLDLDNCVWWRPPRGREVARNLFQIARSFERLGHRREWRILLATYAHTRACRAHHLRPILRDIARRWHRRGSEPCGPFDGMGR